MTLAQIAVLVIQAYAMAGVVVAVGFLVFGIERVEPAARGAYAFRPLIVPGLVLLWPLVLWRWRRIVTGAGADPSLRRGFFRLHRMAWTILAVLLPLIIVGSLALRQSGPLEKPAVPLDERARDVERKQ